MTDFRLRELEGRIIAVIYGAGERDCEYIHVTRIELQADRLFLAGRTVDTTGGGDGGLRVCVAWDTVRLYYVFDSLEHCIEFCQRRRTDDDSSGLDAWYSDN